jgi:hypothetical protein
MAKAMDTRTRDDLGRSDFSAAGQLVEEKAFRRPDVPAVRVAAAGFGTRIGMGATRLGDFVLAASEAAATVVSQGPCLAKLRLWRAGRRVLCEARSDGMLFESGPRAVARGADPGVLRLALLERICDHVSVESGSAGVIVRFSMAVA